MYVCSGKANYYVVQEVVPCSYSTELLANYTKQNTFTLLKKEKMSKDNIC